ncbi:hypothetical protein N658DRAFT_186050 [Parathielavia hyrcaniae]|uniref:Uncharacterized protein n=1 Tax=Parathielavia hyrcaniae TaxID=113614 RepID=A0AAN6Q840_9PEZI|nr:hypothetical protein N658DRAFT_186050 [Parathielavia hyrcaniae]
MPSMPLYYVHPSCCLYILSSSTYGTAWYEAQLMGKFLAFISERHLTVTTTTPSEPTIFLLPRPFFRDWHLPTYLPAFSFRFRILGSYSTAAESTGRRVCLQQVRGVCCLSCTTDRLIFSLESLWVGGERMAGLPACLPTWCGNGRA